LHNLTSTLQANVQQTGPSYLDAPTFARLANPDAERTNTLSPLPDLPDILRSQTPNRPPSTPTYTPGYTALFGETKPLGTRYTGPVLIEENKIESPEDADFAKFKMSIREQMIREFHEEAATLEIILVRKEHEAKLKPDAVKALVAGHELNMEELRRHKEDNRKTLVDAERTKRQNEIRRRNTAPKGMMGTQPEPAVWLNNFTHPKGHSKAWKQVPSSDETYSMPAALADKASAVADIPATPNQPAVGRDAIRVGVGGRSLEVLMGVTGGIERSHG